MPSYLQADRFLRVMTPLGPDQLLLRSFSGKEGLSELFRYELELIAEHSEQIRFEKLLGQRITFQLSVDVNRYRSFNGICSRVSQGQRDATFTYFRMEVVPELWLLTRVVRSRIFQQKSVIEILDEVLEGLTPAPSFRIQGQFHPRDYCVQYRESDFDFVSRLMEEEGIYYYFEHTESNHRLVIANTPQGHTELPSQSAIVYEEAEIGDRHLDRIYRWEKTQELRSGKYTLWDYNFELPNHNLEAIETIQNETAIGTVQHQLEIGNSNKLERYDFPGKYAQRFDGIDPGGGERPKDIQQIFQDNQRTVDIRMEEEAAAGLLIEGAGHCRAMATGYLFNLQEHFDADGTYVVRTVQHKASLGGDYRSEMGGEDTYENTFTCLPLGLPYRPPQKTPKPVIQGTQTATVVGPEGEEIFTDKYSRVKVQFHWDREGSRDENSSCWIRVGTLWAGKQWGAIHIPRIGQEVIVAFEEGDPDCPIIVGSVYNPNQMPPFGLPDSKTISGIKSQTHQGSGYNELTFDDTAGSEKITIHGQHDMNSVVEHDQTTTVRNNRTDQVVGDDSETIGNNQTLSIGNNRTKSVGVNESETIGSNKSIQVGSNHSESIGSNMNLSVGSNKTESVGMNAMGTVGMMEMESVGIAKALNVGVALNTLVGVSSTEQVGVFKSVIVGSKIEICCGASRLVMESGGKVTIEGTEFLFSASGQVKINGAVIDLN